jgi:hypothetical protein
MAKKNEPMPGRSNKSPRPQPDDLGQTGQERERNQNDKRSRIDDEDDEVE